MNYNLDNLIQFLWVGDPHVKKDNLEESMRLINWVAELSNKHRLPVVFAGDQYNDFGIARVECVYFWDWAFKRFNHGTISIVGNHDQNPDGSLNFMSQHAGDTLIVEALTELGPSFTAMPFYRKNENFVNNLKEVKTPYVLCHQEFNGCQYENGFYAPGGVDLASIPDNIKQIISGHIHKEQKFGKVWYPGTPRHLTRSDVGQVKGVYIMAATSEGLKHSFLPTPKEVAEPFTSYEITSEDQLKGIPDSSRVYVDIKGSDEFIKKAVKKVPTNAKTRTFLIQEHEKETTVKESEGIPKAFLNYSLNYFNNKNIGTAEAKVILGKIYDKCPTLKGGS